MPVAAAKLAANADIRSIVQGEALTITVEIYDSVTKQVLDRLRKGPEEDAALAPLTPLRALPRHRRPPGRPPAQLSPR